MRLARVLHCALTMIASGNAFDAGVLNSIKSASDTILGGNRDATDAELLGLENLIDQLVPSEKEEPASGGSEESVPPNTDPGAEPSGDEQGSEVNASEAGDDSSSQEPESVTAIAPPEASSEAPAEPVSEPITAEPGGIAGDIGSPVPSEPLTEVHSDPLSPSEELFQPQSHDEDDGA